MTEQTTATASPATSGNAGGTALAAPLVTTALTSAPAPPRPTPTPDTFTFTSPPAAHRAPALAPTAAQVRLAPLWAATAVAVTVLTAFFVLIVSGRVVTEGPVVAVLTRTHGIHLGDLFALGLWCAATGALLVNALVTTAAVRGVRR